MQAALYLFIGVIGISPALPFVHGPIIDGLLTAYAAVTVAAVGLSIRPGEAGYLSKIIRPVLICAIIPAVWMLIQIMPMPVSGIAHPIWASAQAALDESVRPSISIDRGATLIAFVSYCFAAGMIFVAAAVTVDRRRAEVALFWLAGLTTLSAVLLMALEIDAIKTVVQAAGATPTISLTAVAALGVIVNAAAVDRAVERYETRRASLEIPFAKFVRTLLLCIMTLIICVVAIVGFTNAAIIFATMSGLATFIIIMIIRRLGLDLWMNVIITLAAVMVAAVIIVSNSGSGDFTIRFAFDTPQEMIQVAQSMLSDTRWMGNGAGTWDSLLPVYQNIDRSVVGPYSLTSAATITIELGRPAFLIIVLMVFVLLTVLLRGALMRGRDSFYTTAGTSCVVLLTFEAFCDAAMLEKATIIIAAAILGLALAQSVSRTSQASLARQ